MADRSGIEWTDATVNAINGCSVVSPGCTHCYAMRLAGGRLKHHPSRAGLTIDTKAGPVWNGEVRLHKRAMIQPLGWRRPRMIFWNAHGDTFHPKVPRWWIDHQFGIMAATPQHIHQVLTKRPDRMRQYLGDPTVWDRVSAVVNAWSDDEIGTGNEFTADIRLLSGAPLPNVWLGVSVEDQQRADERIPDLLATPAAVRFLSCEPLLGPVDLMRWMPPAHHHPDNVPSPELTELVAAARADLRRRHPDAGALDWIICGGESGPKARPMHPDWARSLRDQCAAAGVPFFFKQWGEYSPTSDCNGPYMMHVGKKAAGRLLDGVEHNGMPGVPAC